MSKRVRRWAVRCREGWRVTGFVGAALWEASPWLTGSLLALGWLGGALPLIQLRATMALLDSLGGGVPQSSGSPGAEASFLTMLAPLLPWLGLLIGVLILTQIIEAATPFLNDHLYVRTSEILERRIYEKALSLPLAAFESPEYYDRLERARSFLGEGVILVLYSVRNLLSGTIGMLGIALAIAGVSWPCALLLLAGSAPIAVAYVRQMQAFNRINYEQTSLRRKMAYWRDLSTKRGPAAELRLFGLGDYLRGQWRTIQRTLMEELFAARRRFAGTALLITWGTNLLSGVVIAGLVYAGVQGRISAGALVGLLYALQQFEGFRQGYAWQLQYLSRFYDRADHLRQFVTQEAAEPAAGVPAPEDEGVRRCGGVEVTGHDLEVTLSPPHPGHLLIQFEDVSFTYPGAAEPALRGVSLQIRPGERLALVGENGAGKSTLARLLLGLYTPTEGRILVDGSDLSQIDPAAWRGQAAAVFQSFLQYQLTARENIGLGDVRCLGDEARIEAAARRSGAHEVVAPLPKGYETLLGKGFEEAHELSVGQWQKLALARAYLRDAPILVLDEPAASLDALAELEVYREFSRASEGKTVLLISHRLGSARLADRIVVLERGRVVEVGRHEALIASGGPYAEMYELQAAWYREDGRPTTNDQRSTTDDRGPTTDE